LAPCVVAIPQLSVRTSSQLGRQNHMFTVADVIFPAFFVPYVAQIFFPFAAVAALTAEVLFYRWWSKNMHLGRLIVVVLVANVVSSVIGMIVASFLPTGYNPAFRAGQHVPWHAPEWFDYATLAWLVAFIISVLVEWPVVMLLRRVVAIQRTFIAVLFANAASYLVLLLVFFVSVQASRL